MQDADWDIFRIVLAVADAGSAVAAADVLGINASTVLRRIARFEEQQGVKLFDRHQSGYTPTLECTAVLDHVRKMEQQVGKISRSLSGKDLRLEGRVSLTTTDTFLDTILPPLLKEFSKSHKNIQVDVLVTTSRLNLRQNDADVALRATREPSETLIGHKISKLSFGVYGSEEMLTNTDSLTLDHAIEHLPWVGLGEELSGSPPYEWMEKNIAKNNIHLFTTSFGSVCRCVAAGNGVAILPSYLGDITPNVQRVEGPIVELDTDLWVLTHRGYRDAARVRAFTDFLVPALREHRILLQGGERD